VVSVQLKGEEFATVEKSPNHRLFDSKSLLPVLHRRIVAQNNLDKSSNSSPVFNFSISSEIFDLFRPSGVLPRPAPSAPAHNDLSSPFLLAPSRIPDEDMPLSQFCAQYQLSSNILKLLENNSYTYARTLHFVRIEELKEMGFRLGH